MRPSLLRVEWVVLDGGGRIGFVRTVSRRRSSKIPFKALAWLGGLALVWRACDSIATYVREHTATATFVGVAAVGLMVLWVAWRLQVCARRRKKLLGYTIKQLDQLSGLEFEQWIAVVLAESGFRTEETTASGDFGVDVIAEYGSVRFGIQAKRYSSSVGNSAVQEANAGAQYHGCGVAVVVTQSYFTRAAREQASGMTPQCLLFDRNDLPEIAARLRAAAES